VDEIVSRKHPSRDVDEARFAGVTPAVRLMWAFHNCLMADPVPIRRPVAALDENALALSGSGAFIAWARKHCQAGIP
jgi:hypothetical protein